MSRFDERDTMFARMGYEKGSKQYEDYYKNHPEKQENDDRLKTLPNLCSEGTMTYHPVNSKIPDSIFHLLGDINKYSEGEKNSVKTEVSPEEITTRIKKVLKHMGAVEVGVCEMKDEFYYSNRGRKPENYGDVVTPNEKYGIVFAVEMDKDMINRAPMIEEVIEVSLGYLNAGVIGLVGTYFIRELGFDARNHMDGNYLVIAPLVAREAGIGQVGRMGLLTTKKFGPRVRLGVITTNIELVADKPEDWGFDDFCMVCAKCVKSCPAKAIPVKKVEKEDDGLRWQVNHDTCYERWRSLGTDCGVCLSACPFSQEIPQDLVENMKGNKDVMMQILRRHEEVNGIRKFIKEPLDIVK